MGAFLCLKINVDLYCTQHIDYEAPRYIMAAFAHDWLYKIQPDNVTRKQADDVFLYWMKVYGVSRTRRTLMYLAVRAASRGVWRVRHPSYATTDHKHD